MAKYGMKIYPDLTKKRSPDQKPITLAELFAPDLYGFVSSSGRILAPIYTSSDYGFSEGLAAVSTGKSFGYIDKNGNWVIQPRFKFAFNFDHGRAFVQTVSGKYGVIDKAGKYIGRAIYDQIGGSFDPLAPAKIGNKWGFIDSRSQFVIQPTYDSASLFSDGLAQVTKGIGVNAKTGYIDRTGKLVIPLSINSYKDDTGGYWPNTGDFDNGLAVFHSYTPAGERWGFVNKDLKVVIPAEFSESPNSFDNGVQWQTIGATSTQVGGKALMTDKGEVLFFSTYQDVGVFSQGVSSVKIGGKWGFINRKNQLIIKPQFDAVGPYSEGFCKVQINEKWGYID
jgi:hypothetical protein